MLVSMADASHANASGMGTQAGNLVLLMDAAFLEGKEARWGPVFWRSYRLKRVVPSTLAAEAMAMCDALSASDMVAATYLEIVDPSFDLSRRDASFRKLPQAHVTDAKSAYDHVRSGRAPLHGRR